MESDMVADMEVDKVANNVADMMADMEVVKVAGIVHEVYWAEVV